MPWGQQYGQRIDGTPKSSGWLGEIRMPNNFDVMTEQSVGMPNTDEIFRPAIVPNMHPAHINYMRETQEIPEDVYAISEHFAKQRLQQNLSPFYNSTFK